MKHVRLQQAYDYLRNHGIVHTQKQVADKMSSTPQNVSAALNGKNLSPHYIRRFNHAFGDIFNLDWLLNGEGEMLANNNTTNNNIINGNNNIQQINGTSGVIDTQRTLHPMVTDTEFVRAPIVPASVAKEPDLDAFEYIQENIDSVELSNVAVKDMTIHLWYKINDLSMAPRYIEGDMIGLQECDINGLVIPGNVYGLETKSNGIIVRKIYPCEIGYKAKALNTEEYPDFFVKYEDIMRIYRKVIQVRL